jgi:hypothetical protein
VCDGCIFGNTFFVAALNADTTYGTHTHNLHFRTKLMQNAESAAVCVLPYSLYSEPSNFILLDICSIISVTISAQFRNSLKVEAWKSNSNNRDYFFFVCFHVLCFELRLLFTSRFCCELLLLCCDGR